MNAAPSSLCPLKNNPRKANSVITIRQVMNRKVAAVKPNMTVRETIGFLTDNHIGGAPVVDDKGELIGMVSELALIDVVFDERVKDAPISRFMTAELQIVYPDEPIARAAQLFALYAFRRLPVVEARTLVGVITRRDLMNYALRTGQILADPLVEMIPSLALSC
jgi:CBS domain-containing protein